MGGKSNNVSSTTQASMCYPNCYYTEIAQVLYSVSLLRGVGLVRGGGGGGGGRRRQ